MKKRLLSVLLAMMLILGMVGLANATTINYTATDSTDVNEDEDLWQYSYTVSDHSFDADTGFTIYFDLGLYDFLDPFPATPNSEWDILTWNPDPSIPDGGAYDACAMIDNASLSDAFTIDFVWLGGDSAAPGSQSFEVYDSSFSTLETGTTTPATAPVPEPATMFLFGTGLAGIFGFSNIRKRIKK